jgi:hypothetical protein
LVKDVLLDVRLALASAFDAEIIAAQGIPLPSSAYDGERRQYHSTPIPSSPTRPIRTARSHRQSVEPDLSHLVARDCASSCVSGACLWMYEESASVLLSRLA